MPLAGPVAVLILDRAFRGARRSAGFIACGAALAESIYVLAVGLALPLLLTLWPSLLTVTRAAGAGLLVCVGLLLLLHPSLISSSEPRRRGGDFVTGLAAAGFNPTLLASWTAVTSALYGEGWLEPVPGTAPLLALGVALGVVSWFLLAIRFASRFRDRMNAARRRNLVRGFGLFLLAIGTYVGVRLV
jgi:threonine/homoserine/homoserine lactone efflux protein